MNRFQGGTRGRVAAVAIFAVGAGLMFASPARAASFTTSCEANPGDHVVGATVYYSAATATQHYWSTTVFRLGGSSGTGGKSNMNISVWVNRRKVAERKSLDNVAKHYTYHSAEHPRFQLNVYTTRAYPERVDFLGDFDTALIGDPFCIASTPTI